MEKKYYFEKADFNSELWEQLHGAYGNILEDLTPLTVKEPQVPDNEKILSPGSYESEYMVAFDNICCQLEHQMDFYPASYLAMPYLAEAFNYWYEKDDFIMQVLFLLNAGIIVSTYIEYNNPGYNNIKDIIPENIMESYNQSILFFREKAEELLINRLDMLKQFKPDGISYICTALVALAGKKEHAFVLLLGSFSQCTVICENCGFFSEEIELDMDYHDDNEEANKGLNSLITPAPSVLGKWDKKSLGNTYMWLSNVLHIMGNDYDAKKLSYFYGTFTCPECGTKSEPVIDLCVKALMEY